MHEHVDEPFLVSRGLTNYWGYNTIGFFAPHHAYAAGHTTTSQVQEFRAMVRAFHDAGIEVILDVVYNHTGEGNHLGPSLCFKGFDNRFYRWLPDHPGQYLDFTGTGNSLNMDHPYALQMVMDSLRYWVTDMHVDGFRFDLAVTLARENYRPDRLSAFFDLIHQDPVLDQVKLIAEPWDVGEGGYQVGNFPPGWSEWNGKYRDCVRDYWRGRERGAARVRDAAVRLQRSLLPRGPHAVREHQLHHRPRRLHPRATWPPTTPSTTRPTRRPTATGPTTTARGTAGSRARPTTR